MIIMLKGSHYTEKQKKQISESVKRAYNEGRLKPPLKGKIFTPEECKKRSEIMKKLLKEGKVKNPMEGRKHKKSTRVKMKLKRLEWIKKHPEFMVGKNNPMYGKPNYWRGKKIPLKYCKKMSKTKKKLYKEGKLKPHNLGKKFSEEHKRNMIKSWTAERRKKMGKYSSERFQNENWCKKLGKSLNLRPNKKEKILIELLKQNNLPYKYVGDYSFWINGRNPDFLNVNGQKKVIELFGTYWHDSKHFPNRPTDKELKNHYENYGFKCLVILENELNNPENVIQKLKEFEYGKA